MTTPGELHPPPQDLPPGQVLSPDEIENPKLHIAKAVGAGLLGLAAGVPAGYGTAAGINWLYNKATKGKNIPPSYLYPTATALGGTLGLTYGLYKAYEAEEIRRAFESERNRARQDAARELQVHSPPARP